LNDKIGEEILSYLVSYFYCFGMIACLRWEVMQSNLFELSFMRKGEQNYPQAYVYEMQRNLLIIYACTLLGIMRRNFMYIFLCFSK